jgi:CubicO group peptidase (beta-lactamase class C family)
MTRRELVLAVPALLRASVRFDAAFEFVRTTTKHGGLLISHRGELVFERYFGKAAAESTPNLASVGKSFTSIAAGILMHEKPYLFRNGLDTKVFIERLMPKEVFPLRDARKAEIRLGHLLTMTSGIRGNSPGFVLGRPVPIEPPVSMAGRRWSMKTRSQRTSGALPARATRTRPRACTWSR